MEAHTLIATYDILPDADLAGALLEIIPGIPEWRRRKVLSYRFDIDKFLCAKAFLMLEESLKSYGLAECPEFSYGTFGKPYFMEYPGIHFSISHCSRGIACAVSDSPVGIDIERIQYDDLTAQKVLNADEYRKTKVSDNPAEIFTELWTKKESLLKLAGLGLVDDMRDVITDYEGIHCRSVIDKKRDYVYSLACNQVSFPKITKFEYRF